MPLPVLLVEDDPTTHLLVRAALTASPAHELDAAFALEGVTTLAAALARLREGSVAAVLLDLSLPDSEGLATFRAIRDVAPEVPVVIVTGTDDDALALTAVREGAQDWVVKGGLDPALLPRLLRYAIERRRADQLLAESAEALRTARQHAAVGRLAGGMAHAFNNMLTVIRCSGELLRDQLTDGQARDDVVHMLDAASRASSLVRQLLAFGSRQVLRPVAMDIGLLVQAVAPVLSRALGDTVRLVVETAPQLPAARVDPAQFEQVLVQLVLDARDALVRGGTVRVTTAQVEVECPEPHAHGLITPGRYVVLAVHDDAPLDAVSVTHIFEPFFARAGGDREGSLGLAVVYGIVRQSGGHIRVRNEGRDGTTFEVYLPALAAGQPAPSLAQPQGDAGVGDQRILVVEDDSRVRALVVRVLERHGWTVASAGSGREALAILEAQGGAFDLMLTDLSMPDVGGKELVDLVRARWGGLRLLFMSGYADDEPTREAMGSEVPFLAKPFTAAELATAVREAWLAEPAPWPTS
ncbi:MAG: response regulator [Gemmatimonadaceae bacterium]|nr:response regulator [Gemmatimonadaceae bacterium]